MDVCQTRLEREFDLDLICTAPSVVYQVAHIHVCVLYTCACHTGVYVLYIQDAMCMLYMCVCYTDNVQCVCHTCE